MTVLPVELDGRMEGSGFDAEAGDLIVVNSAEHSGATSVMLLSKQAYDDSLEGYLRSPEPGMVGYTQTEVVSQDKPRIQFTVPNNGIWHVLFEPGKASIGVTLKSGHLQAQKPK